MWRAGGRHLLNNLIVIDLHPHVLCDPIAAVEVDLIGGIWNGSHLLSEAGGDVDGLKRSCDGSDAAETERCATVSARGAASGCCGCPRTTLQTGADVED